MKAYVDGSYHTKYKMSSYGFLILNNSDEIIETQNGIITNEEMNEMRNVAGEITAVLMVMIYCKSIGIKDIDIFYDYNGIEMWATNTKKPWKTKNKFTERYRKCMLECYKNGFNVKFHKVKAHSKDKFNDKADKLAKSAFKEFVN